MSDEGKIYRLTLDVEESREVEAMYRTRCRSQIVKLIWDLTACLERHNEGEPLYLSASHSVTLVQAYEWFYKAEAFRDNAEVLARRQESSNSQV